jgi:hypothetical protein
VTDWRALLKGKISVRSTRMSENAWTKILGWQGYRVYRSEIDEVGKTLRLWVRRKRGNRKLECSGCGPRIGKVAVELYLKAGMDLACFCGCPVNWYKKDCTNPMTLTYKIFVVCKDCHGV